MIITVFYFIPLVVVIYSFMVLVRDTPMCLVMRNSSHKAVSQFRFIAKMNKKHFEIDAEEITKVKAQF